MINIVGKCFMCMPLLVIMYLCFQTAIEGYSYLANLKPKPKKPSKTKDLLQNDINQTKYNKAMVEREMDKREGETLLFIGVTVLLLLCVPLVLVIIS